MTNKHKHKQHFKVFQHGLQDGYLGLNPHVKGGLFPLTRRVGYVRRPLTCTGTVRSVRRLYAHGRGNYFEVGEGGGAGL